MLDKYQHINAFLIHRRNYQENDLLLDFFTLEYGMLRCIGKHSRRSRKHINAFVKLNIRLSSKGELKRLLEWETIETGALIQGQNLILALYANELIYKLCPSYEALPVLFKQYHLLISLLNQVPKLHQYWLLRLFENQLLTVLGFGLDYAFDASGKVIENEKQYKFIKNVGLVADNNGVISGLSLQHLKENKAVICPNKTVVTECRYLLQEKITTLLDNKQIYSRALLQR